MVDIVDVFLRETQPWAGRNGDKVWGHVLLPAVVMDYAVFERSAKGEALFVVPVCEALAKLPIPANVLIPATNSQ